jgi:hypothetical protein
MLLEVLLLGGLMGILGQGARAVVGLKGMADNAKALDLSPNDLFEAARLIVSILIGFLVGLAAALIYINTTTPLVEPNFQALIGFAASGYVGVDFLEGFISQYLSPGASGSTVQRPKDAQAIKPGVPKPTFPPDKAQSIVIGAFTAIGFTNVKPTDTLSTYNIKTPFDIFKLLEAVNGQIEKIDNTHLLPLGAATNWAKVSDVIASVEYAPTSSPPVA